ncbi:MAG: flagellar biosynthesis protein FlhA [Armatimonadetes bacterium]|nr:flagellar biosynthesis protein FlhA [Armatimonadota bacterium]MBS1711734.1 flagellar biosynthesis protein FlhA [Armatimonadota bacterium]MBX3109712.1 flagellar biosynthesis protein FlhA [Fimbriimonadaceae bacterium]
MAPKCAYWDMDKLGRLFKNTDLILGLGMILVVGMLILPLPDFILDTGLVVAMAASVVIMLTAVNVKEPLHFSVFPSLLVVTTLLRVSLSIAATKLILGTGSAGHVIETFGEFVLGGNFVVGFISFIILMIVQFVVITQGSTRVSEVVARFTLDAMPGKQMAIDADLASGLIDESQARERRKSVKAEADFYGAMDGASKFVKGDAIASLLIIIVNIIGGFIMGFMRGEGDVMAILGSYAMLSVGEGMVSQIPALLISTSAGLLVTRNGQESGMANSMFGQLLNQPRVLATAGGAMSLFAFVPGFPTIIFLGMGGLLFALSRLADKNPSFKRMLSGEPEPVAAAPETQAPPATGPEQVMALVNVDPIEIEIGYGLTKLADVRSGGDLSDRVGATRRQIATELGYVMPSVRIRDNAVLKPNDYVIKIRGESVAHATAFPNEYLAIDSGTVLQQVAGTPTTEPVFQLPALWIEPGQREMAERNGYTVVEPAAMMTTHLTEVIKSHAAELLSRQEASKLVENTKSINETVVNELEPAGLGTGDVQKVLQHLLRERVPIRDMVTILETMADFAGRIKDMEQMGELVRSAIARTITRQFADERGALHCLTLEPPLEHAVTEAIQHTAAGASLALEPELARQLTEDVRGALDQAHANGIQPVLICSTQVRLPLRKHLDRNGVQIPVMAYNEVAANADVEFVGQIGLDADAASSASVA